MQTTRRLEALSLDSIEDYLGPAAGRFFGAGYRRVQYRLLDIEKPAGADPQLNAAVAIDYPVDWSRKKTGTDLRPHLSTVDVLILSARFAEATLAGAYALNPGQLRRAWLRRVDIKAGSQPYEDGLDRVPVRVRMRDTGPDPSGEWLSRLDCAVGNMQIQCEVVHEAADYRPDPDAVVVSQDRDSLYGAGFAYQRQDLSDVLVDVPRLRASAVAEVHSTDGRVARERLEGAYAPGFSMIDSFVISLQLGQVLLYELDDLTRAGSETLWMRQTTIVADTPYRPAAGAIPVAAALHDSRLVTARGVRWRTAAIVGRTQGLTTRCAVAHQLPDA